MDRTGTIYGVNGPVIYVKNDPGFKIAEIAIYDRALSDDERRNVDAYLKKKWLGS